MPTWRDPAFLFTVKMALRNALKLVPRARISIRGRDSAKLVDERLPIYPVETFSYLSHVARGA